jgi:hypothetical protein
MAGLLDASLASESGVSWIVITEKGEEPTTRHDRAWMDEGYHMCSAPSDPPRLLVPRLTTDDIRA